jgi:hypothetical protein
MDEEKKSLSATQPITPPTAADVLEVFGHFQDGLLKRIDERDELVLKLIQKTVSELLADNRRLAQRSDDLEKRTRLIERGIEDLRLKQNELASEVQTIKLALKRVDPKP